MRPAIALCTLLMSSVTYAEISAESATETGLTAPENVALAADRQGNISYKNADHTGFYVGGGLGKSDEEWDVERRGKYDFDGAALLAYGGYNFTDWFGLEAMLNTNLETNAATAFSISPKFTLQFNDDISVFVKFGLNIVVAGDLSSSSDDEYDDDGWDIFDYQVNNNGARSQQSRASDGSDLELDDVSGAGMGFSYGIGANIRIAKGFHLRAGLEKTDTEIELTKDYSYRNDLDIDTQVDTLTTYLGAYYQF